MAESLVRLLTKRQRADADENDGIESRNMYGKEATDLFDGPEPHARVTDYVDMLLDEAAKNLARFVQDETKISSDSSQLRPLENKPQVFEKNKKSKINNDTQEGIEKKTMRGAQDKPQDRFDEIIDNSDTPFVSKLREKVHSINDGHAVVSVDDDDDEMGLRHPYFSEIKRLKYAPWQLEVSEEPYEKVELDEATCMWVDTEQKLMQMMQLLTSVETRAIAVDLEHHSYRSYMGLTCLMQLSTAREDFLVDTLALRGKLQVLNQVFCNPEKVKVLHGSDMDIMWLQRDLGLYVVNLFDTGRAARLLQYPRFSLAYMLKRHCNVDADKQYQLADWRVRPLDTNMVKYAREDTRYLLFIYDRLKKELLEAGTKSRESLLFQTLQDSNKLCLQVYEKPRVTKEDALAVGEKLKGTVNIRILSDLQKCVIVALYIWRDRVAREEDESVAYVMPNHVLMKLTKHLPVRSDELFRACHPVPLLIRKHALQITNLIIAEKAKVAEIESKTEQDCKQIPVVKSTRTIWNENGEEQTVFSSTMKRVGRVTYAPWKSGERKARVTEADETLIGSSSFGFIKPMVLGVPIVESVANSKIAATRLEEVNAMVSSTIFTIAESEQVDETPVGPRTCLSELYNKDNDAADDTKTKIPQSISETYHMSNRSRRQHPTPHITSSASKVKERAQAFMQKVGNDDTLSTTTHDTEEKATSGVSHFDYAAVSNEITAAKFELQKDEDNGHHGSYGHKKQRGYNPFVAMNGRSKKSTEPKGAQVKKVHHMPRSATFR